MNAGQRGEWHFSQTDATVVLKEDAALDVIKDVKVTWHTAKNGDLYSEFVLCNYPILGVHTHTSWTHTRSSGQPFMLRCPGSSWGLGALLKGTSVVVLRVERALYIHSPLLHDYINYAKEFTLSFIHMLTFFHTHASVKCYNISVNVVVYLCTLMPE